MSSDSQDSRTIDDSVFYNSLKVALRDHFPILRKNGDNVIAYANHVFIAGASFISTLPYIYPNWVDNDRAAWGGVRYVLDTLSSVSLNYLFTYFFSLQVKSLWRYQTLDAVKKILAIPGKLEALAIKLITCALAAYIYTGLISITPWLDGPAWYYAIIGVFTYAQLPGIEEIFDNRLTRAMMVPYHSAIQKLLSSAHPLHAASLIAQEGYKIRIDFLGALAQNYGVGCDAHDVILHEVLAAGLSGLSGLDARTRLNHLLNALHAKGEDTEQAIWRQFIDIAFAGIIFTALQFSLLGWFCSIWEPTALGMSVPFACAVVNTGLHLFIAKQNLADIKGENEYPVLKQSPLILSAVVTAVLLFLGGLSAEPSIELNAQCEFLEEGWRTALNVDTVVGIAYFNIFSFLPLFDYVYTHYQVNHNKDATADSVNMSRRTCLKDSLSTAIKAVPDEALVTYALTRALPNDANKLYFDALEFLPKHNITLSVIISSLLMRAAWIAARLTLMTALPEICAQLPLIALGILSKPIMTSIMRCRQNRAADGATQPLIAPNGEATRGVISPATHINVVALSLAISWGFAYGTEQAVMHLLTLSGGDESLAATIGQVCGSAAGYTAAVWSNQLISGMVP